MRAHLAHSRPAARWHCTADCGSRGAFQPPVYTMSTDRRLTWTLWVSFSMSRPGPGTASHLSHSCSWCRQDNMMISDRPSGHPVWSPLHPPGPSLAQIARPSRLASRSLDVQASEPCRPVVFKTPPASMCPILHRHLAPRSTPRAGGCDMDGDLWKRLLPPRPHLHTSPGTSAGPAGPAQARSACARFRVPAAYLTRHSHMWQTWHSFLSLR